MRLYLKSLIEGRGMQITANEALIKWRVAQSNVDRLTTEKETQEEELKRIEKDLIDWDGAKTLLELLKNYKLEKRKDFILGVINQALVDVFQEDYRLDIIPREMKGKSAASTQKYDIVFFHNGIETAKNDELLSSNGGGVLSIASLFFKLLIGYLYSKNKFYMFDESLSQVSPQYRDRLSLFLQEFCKRYGFTLVVVSQTEELETHADIVYEVASDINKDGVPILKIANTQGEMPTENFYYSHIKNFQSIVDLTFLYKGFTIIRGPNNSGKSASLRAINSILFNDFKKDLYPRKNPNGRKLTTEITFGFQGPADTPAKEIGLVYKSNKVMFRIDGEEYFGKSLAADKIKEAVEEIGFRYLDVKAAFKNFKGPMKDQAERIASTSQHDGLFLIGARTSDSEKIFSFLFNTESIALAIAEAKEAMQEFNKLHKDTQALHSVTIDDLRRAKLEIEYYLKVYYAKLIEEFQITKATLQKIKKSQQIYEDITQKISTFVNIIEGSAWLEQTAMSLDSIKNKIELNTSQQETLNKILDLVNLYSTSVGLIKIQETKLKFSEQLEILNKIIPEMQSVVSINYYVSLDNQKISLENRLRLLETASADLDQEYHLQTCSCCSGLGVQAF